MTSSSFCVALGSQRALGLMGVLPSRGVYYLPGSSAERGFSSVSIIVDVAAG